MMMYMMAYVVVVSVPILLAAVVGARTLRNARRPERLVWLGALALTFALPLIGLTRASADTAAERIPPPSVAEQTSTVVAPLPETGLVGLPDVLEVPPTPQVVLTASDSRLDLDAALMIIWALASFTLLIRWSVGSLRLHRRLKAATPGIEGDIEVWFTRDVGPAVAGVVRPRVVLPEWLSSLPQSQRTLVVEHEHEHVRAADPLVVAVARAARIATPWNPVTWLLTSYLKRGVELDCDRRVLRRHPDVETYGSTLLAISSLHQGSLYGAAAFAETSLRQRILAMTTRPGSTSIVSVVGALVLGAVLLVGVFEVPVPAVRMHLDVEPPVGGDPPFPVTTQRLDAETERLSAEIAALREQVAALSQLQTRTSERADAAESELQALLDRLASAESAMEERPVVPVDQSRTGTITGVMADEVSGLRLPRVQVYLRGTGIGGLTNDQGRYVLMAVPPGEHEVVAERIGYRESTQTVSVIAGEATPADFLLREVAVQLGGVLVTEDPVVRRNTWDHPRILIDGMPVGDHEYGLDRLDELQAEGRIESIEVFQPEEAMELFGSRYRGGVIGVTTKDPDAEREWPDRDVSAPGQPTFTPFTVRPQLLNPDEVEAAIQEAYPQELREGGVGGTVHVYLFINDRGTVEDTRISQSSGYQALDDAALATAAIQRFSPALNRDEAVAVWVSMPMTFLQGM